MDRELRQAGGRLNGFAGLPRWFLARWYACPVFNAKTPRRRGAEAEAKEANHGWSRIDTDGEGAKKHQ